MKDRVFIYDLDDFSWVRSIEVEDDSERQVSSLMGVIENGFIVTMSRSPFLNSDDGSRSINDDRHYELTKVKPNGNYAADLFGAVGAGEAIQNVRGKGGLTFIFVPLARSSPWAVGPDEVVYYGWSNAIEIALVTADRSIREVISYGHDPVTVTDAELDEHQPKDAFSRDVLAAHGPHEINPAFQSFVIDDKGRTWKRLSTRKDLTQAEWLILNKNHRPWVALHHWSP